MEFMHEKGEIDDEALEEVNWMVKEEMAEWIDEMEKFENLAYSDDLFEL